ncbi:MAG: UDP-N-acetylglucosamine 2-epimerase (hydrolyzing), partial [Rhodobacterales bacterium]|nr:UDP-N-acetylglucosamine 2-epimerase (hydrolyzing) [Rhodobacterales bacterium]
DVIFSEIEQLPRDRFRVLPSMRFAHFSELMKNAACIVGNSSAGVREAPFLCVPSLDVGTRQNRRSESNSITNVKADDQLSILKFLKNEWGKRYPKSKEFGQGSAAERFVRLLQSDTFWQTDLQKTFVDHA